MKVLIQTIDGMTGENYSFDADVMPFMKIDWSKPITPVEVGDLVRMAIRVDLAKQLGVPVSAAPVHDLLACHVSGTERTYAFIIMSHDWIAAKNAESQTMIAGLAFFEGE